MNNDGNYIENENSELYSEIISDAPNILIRVGSFFISLTIIIVLVLLWFIEFPISITEEIYITTTTPPIKLVNKSSGIVDKILVKDNQKVYENQEIIIITNPVNLDAVNYLRKFVDSINLILKGDGSLTSVQFTRENIALGNFENHVNAIEKLFTKYYSQTDDLLSQNNVQGMRKKAERYKRLNQILEEQLKIEKRSYSNSQALFDMQEKLYHDKIISKSEYLEEKEKLLSSLKRIKLIESQIQNNYIEKEDLKNQLDSFILNHIKEREDIENELKSELQFIENKIIEWKKTYSLTAPFDGTLFYSHNISKEEFIEAETPIATVIPNNKELIGIIRSNHKLAGKIKKSSKVIISLDSYPEVQFGELSGNVISISPVDNKSKNNSKIDIEYLINVQIPESIFRVEGGVVKYNPNMSGSARIILENRKILDYIIYDW